MGVRGSGVSSQIPRLAPLQRPSVGRDNAHGCVRIRIFRIGAQILGLDEILIRF